jgi:predicted nucleotide-binding protein
VIRNAVSTIRIHPLDVTVTPTELPTQVHRILEVSQVDSPDIERCDLHYPETLGDMMAVRVRGLDMVSEHDLAWVRVRRGLDMVSEHDLAWDAAISHVQKDAGVANTIAAKLRYYRLKVWLAQDSRKLGEPERDLAVTALEIARIVFVVISSQYVNTAWENVDRRRHELDATRESADRLILIPVIVNNTRVPDQLDGFRSVRVRRFAGSCILDLGFPHVAAEVARLVRVRTSGDPPDVKQRELTQEQSVKEKPMASDEVFVIHGRNQAARDGLFTFLRALSLKPIEWDKAVAATGDASPYIGAVLDAALERAQAIIVLMTPDEVAYLQDRYASDAGDPEAKPSEQARPNVIFEAGMAIGRDAKRTILVEMGKVRPFSDVAGRHAVRLDNSAAKRKTLAERLRSAGCPVDIGGTDWLSVGDLTPPDQNPRLR